MEEIFDKANESQPHLQVSSVTSFNHGQTCDQDHELRGQLHENEVYWTDECKKEHLEKHLTPCVIPDLRRLVNAFEQQHVDHGGVCNQIH